MAQSSENKIFTASDIERYHSGQMAAEERHALEKAALDDPFLADALEGYTYTTSPAADLQAIRERLFENEEPQRKTVPLFRQSWFRAAAVFLVIAGSAWIAFTIFSPQDKGIAASEQMQKTDITMTETTESAAPAITVTDSTIGGTTVFTVPKSEAELKYYNKKLPGNTWSRSNFSVKAPDKDIVANGAGLDSSEIKDAIVSASPPVQETTPDRNFLESYNRVYNRDETQNRARPSPDGRYNQISNNQAANNQMASRQQQNGFSRALETDSSNAVNRNLAQAKKTAPNANDTIRNFDVVLKPTNLPPQEVIVLDTRPKSAIPTRQPRVIIDTLEPADGWARFDDYVVNNLKSPEELKIKELKGEVQLSFDVDRNGQPTNITVLKSLCDKCDEEAIRLLKEGPKWKKRKDKKGRITIRF